MLESLGKTVVITGSQLPIFEARSDGLINFLSSLIIAGNYNIPEVCVFFGNQLMRGNRTSKIASAAFEAFASPNCAPLAVAGVKINGKSITSSIDFFEPQFEIKHQNREKNVEKYWKSNFQSTTDPYSVLVPWRNFTFTRISVVTLDCYEYFPALRASLSKLFCNHPSRA